METKEDGAGQKWVKDNYKQLGIEPAEAKTIAALADSFNEQEKLDLTERSNQAASQVRIGIIDGSIKYSDQIDEILPADLFGTTEKQEFYDMLTKRSKPSPKTDWGDYMKLEDSVMNYLLKAEGINRQDIEKSLQDAYKTNIGDTEFMNLWNRLDIKLPSDTLMHLKKNIIANREKAYEGFWNFRFTKAEKEEVARINAALFEQVLRDMSAGKEPTATEIYTQSREMRIPTTAKSKEQRIRVKNPEGLEGTIPISQIEEAKAEGYEILE